MSFAVDQMDHVEVYVRDIEASTQWYAKVLGLKEIRRWDPEPVMIGAGDTKLALFRAADDAQPQIGDKPRSPLRWSLVAWRTTAEGFQQAQEHLSECGVLFDGPIDHQVAKSIYFVDLDGHPLEITCYYDKTPSVQENGKITEGDEQP